jgi:hypothetical protein
VPTKLLEMADVNKYWLGYSLSLGHLSLPYRRSTGSLAVEMADVIENDSTALLLSTSPGYVNQVWHWDVQTNAGPSSLETLQQQEKKEEKWVIAEWWDYLDTTLEVLVQDIQKGTASQWLVIRHNTTRITMECQHSSYVLGISQTR